jgi:hypothetical protein
MGGSTKREISAALHNPEANKKSRQWANIVCQANTAAQRLHHSFTPAEKHTANSLAQRGNIIFSAGDPTSVIEDLPPTIDEEDFSELHQSRTTPKGVRFIAARIRKWTKWRNFVDLHSRTLARDQPKLLTHAGHGSVTILQSSRPLGNQASSEIARTTIRRITDAHSLGRHKPSAN